MNKKSIVSIGIISFIVLAVFFLYPYLIGLLIDYNCSKALPKYNKDTVEAFSNIFDSLNTIFSAFGLVGIIWTIMLQIDIYKKQNEKEEERNNQADINKMIYIKALFTKTLSDIEDFITKMRDEMEKEYIHYSISISFNQFGLKRILSEITQEEFYLAFKRIKLNDNMIDAFTIFEEVSFEIDTIQIRFQQIHDLYNDEKVDSHQESFTTIRESVIKLFRSESNVSQTFRNTTLLETKNKNGRTEKDNYIFDTIYNTLKNNPNSEDIGNAIRMEINDFKNRLEEIRTSIEKIKKSCTLIHEKCEWINEHIIEA